MTMPNNKKMTKNAKIQYLLFPCLWLWVLSKSKPSTTGACSIIFPCFPDHMGIPTHNHHRSPQLLAPSVWRHFDNFWAACRAIPLTPSISRCDTLTVYCLSLMIYWHCIDDILMAYWRYLMVYPYSLLIIIMDIQHHTILR